MEFVLALILFALGFLFIISPFILVSYVIEKKKQTLLRESPRLSKLKMINSKYSNLFDISYNKKFSYHIETDSVAKWKRFSTADCALSIAKGFYDEFLPLNDKYLFNEKIYQDYLNEYNDLPNFLTRDSAHIANLSKRFILKNEMLLDEKIRIDKDIYDISITEEVTYTSPAGRNHYSKTVEVPFKMIIQRAEYLQNIESIIQSQEYQRKLMTSSLRYDVMKRDGFKCTLCGRSANDGVKLHVDHIIPVSKGGQTTVYNLRTLCQDCNLGKSDKYSQDDLN